LSFQNSENGFGIRKPTFGGGLFCNFLDWVNHSANPPLTPLFLPLCKAELALSPPTLGDDTVTSTTMDSDESTDFILQNMKVTKKELTGRNSVASTTASTTTRHKTGTVPKYLKARQEEWKEAEEQRIAAIPDPCCPPGHRLIGEEERTSRLEEQEKRQELLLRDLACLPVSVDTRRVREKRKEIEQGLEALDLSMRHFSRSKVYARIEEEQ